MTDNWYKMQRTIDILKGKFKDITKNWREEPSPEAVGYLACVMELEKIYNTVTELRAGYAALRSEYEVMQAQNKRILKAIEDGKI